MKITIKKKSISGQTGKVNDCFTASVKIKTLLISFSVFLSFFISNSTFAQTTELIPAGSYIVNMGVSPQTVGNGLKPYGLVYDLLKNYNTPVIWSINPNKTSQSDADFSIGATAYKGGPFIILAKYRTAAVNARITHWQTQGVVGVTTATAVTVPVYLTFKYAPFWVLDKANGNIAVKFFNAAGIPADAYGGSSPTGWKNPSELDACDDLFVMPHADPNWGTHGNLKNFVETFKGSIWSGCHAVSALENMVDPANKATVQTNFLTVKDPSSSLINPLLTSDKGVANAYASSNSLLLWKDLGGNLSHADGSTPYTNRLFGDPIAQYIGSSDAAHTGGSEQIYIPRQTGGVAKWNPDAKIISYDPTQANVTSLNPNLSNAAAVNVYGRAYDNTNNGYVMYQGGHDISGNGTANVAAQRMFFNFSFVALTDRMTSRLGVAIEVPSEMVIDRPYTLRAIGTSPGVTYQWSSSVAGTFSAPTSAVTTFTPTGTASLVTISCVVTDGCSRSNAFETRTLAVKPTPTINVAPASLTLTTVCQNEVLPTGSFSITATDVSSDLSVSAPAGFQVSATSTGTYTTAMTVTYNAATSTASQTVYVRPISTAVAGTASGVVIVDYVGVQKTVTVTATVNPLPVITTSGTKTICAGQTTTITSSGASSYFWSTGASTASVTLSPGSTTTYTVTGTSLGCSTTSSVTVTVNPLPVLTISGSNTICNGSTTTLTASGAASYTWSSGANTASVSLSPTGTTSYTVTGTSASGCTSTSSVTVTVNALPGTPSATVTQLPDCTISTGTVSVTTSVVGLTFKLVESSTYTSTGIFTGIPAGTYTLTSTNANGCESLPTSITINPFTDAPPVPVVSLVQPTCLLSTGSASVTIDVTGLTFSLSSASGTSTNTTGLFTGLPAGTYSLTATKNSNGCNSEEDFTINAQPPTPGTPSFSITQPSCNVSTGVVSITSSITGLGFTLTGAATYSNTLGIFQNIPSGSYSLTATNTDGCSSTATLVTINVQPQTPSATATKTNALCFGAADGAIQITASGGTSPHTYKLNDGTFQASPLFNGLAAGTYTLTVIDANTCYSSTTVTVSEPTSITATVTMTPALCNAGSTGQLTISAGGGTPSYSYKIEGGTYSSTTVFTGLAAGTYSLTVKDANACTATFTSTVTEPNPLVLTTNIGSVSCKGGADGAINLSVSGGTGTYSYTWSNLAITQDISDLAAGTYSVTVTDANNCSTSTSVVVTEPSVPLSISSLTKSDLTCIGSSNGSINLTVAGGTPGYAYDWVGTGSFSSTSQNLTGLPAGTYTLTVTDAKLVCYVETTVVIGEPVALTATSTQTNVACFGGSSGAINLTVSGGTGTKTYSWSGPGTYSSTLEDISGLSASTYNVTVTDANSCTVTASVVITQPLSALSATSTQTNVSCNSGSTGAINLTVSGGTGAKTYSWTGPATYSSTLEDINGLSAGTYNVTVTDANSCTVTASVVITQPTAVTIGTVSKTLYNGAQLSCATSTDGELTITASGGTGALQYLIEGGTGYQNQNNFPGLAAGTYTITVRDGNSCVSTSTVTTLVAPTALSATSIQTNVLCNGGITGAINLTVTGGTGAKTFTWTGPGTYSSTLEDINGLRAGTYSVTVTDANGCSITSSVTITQAAVFSATITSTASTICNGASVTLTVPEGTAWTWSNGATTQSITVSPTSTTNYTVTATNADLCAATVSSTVTVNPLPTITGTTSVCVSATTQLTGSPTAAAWTSANTSIATVNTTGLVTGVSAGSVTITYRNSLGCSQSTVVIVNPLPPTPSVTNGLRSGEGSVTLTASAVAGAVVDWYANPFGGTPFATATTTYTTGVISATQDYHVEARFTATGCISASRARIVAEIYGTIDPGDIAAAQSYCGTATATLLTSNPDATVSPSTPISYQWFSSTDGTNYTAITGAVSTTYNPGTVSTTTWYKRKASATVGSTLTENFTGAIQIVIKAVPTVPAVAHPAGGNTFCEGGSVELTGPNATKYQWFQDGNIIIGGVEKTYTATVSGNYTLKVENAVGCSATSTPVKVTVNTLPSIPAIAKSGPTTFCEGGSVTLSSSEDESAYKWYKGSTLLSATTKSITVTETGVYKLVTTNAAGCSNERGSAETVTVNSLPAVPTISTPGAGSTTFCEGGSVVLTSSSAKGYQWYNGTTKIDGATAQTYEAKVSGEYKVEVFNEAGCSILSTDAVKVTVNPVPAKPVVAAAGPTTICAGESLALSITATGSIKWFRNGTEIKDSVRGTLIVRNAGTYTAQVTSAEGCVSELSSGVTVLVNPQPSITVSIAVCKGRTIQLEGSGTPAAVKPWVSSDLSIATIDDKGRMTALKEGKVNITYTVSNGCSITREIDVNITPPPPGNIIGPIVVAPGFNVLFSVPPAAGATNYTWNFPAGWTGTGNGNVATAQPGSNSGFVSVVASENGCTSDTVIQLINVDTSDVDKDGIYDLLDLDNDNDGILDSTENKQCNPATKDCDTDGDGRPNYLDADSDGDCIPDVVEANGTDANGDGIADGKVDANGVPGSAKGGLTPPDTDKDGKPDAYDTDTDGDAIPDNLEKGADCNNPVDTDGDGTPDYRDLDSDGDGIPDSTERGTDGNKPRDTDKDGIPDYLDLDSDNDGITDKSENGNGPAELDTDGDKIPDYLDLDSDSDGITDVVEADGTDSDKDGRADGKSDRFGIPESAKGGLTPPDTDRDGRRDFQDVESDGDGIPDNVEGQGSVYVRPSGKDTDKDGIDDAYDDRGYITPVDTDKDGRPDYRDVDSDADGIPDSYERGADGNNPVDTDKDGTPDYRDLDSDNDTIPDIVEAIDAFSGNTNPANPVDTDRDGTPDFRDLDSENDTIPDADEAGPNPTRPADTDNDGRMDFRDTDSNNNGIPDGETLLIWKKATDAKLHSPLGEMEVTFKIILTNQRPEPLTNVQIREDLTRTFPSPMTFRVTSVVSNGVLRTSSTFNGSTDLNMLTSGITLQGYQQDSVTFTVVFDPAGFVGEIKNLATGTATTKWFNVTRESIDIVNSNGRMHGPGDPTESKVPFIDIIIPDVITPNGDGFNDRLVIQRPSGVKVNITIFNRWGQMVFKSDNYKNDWNGQGPGGFLGNQLPQGTYFYLIELTGGPVQGGKQVKKGYITLKRDYF